MTSTPELDRKLNGGENPKPTSADEEDPCIQEADNKLHKRNFRERTEQKLREKSGLSKRGLQIAGLVLLLLFILLITVIALAIAWPRTPHHRQYPVCEEAACLEASAQVQQALNSSISPCSDVWNWACGGWLIKNPLPTDRSLWNKREQLRVQESARVRELISTLPLPVHTGTVEWKLKHLYESCMEVENIDADGVRPLQRFITDLGGWRILRAWNYHSWDFRRVLEKLHSEYGATPFFKVTVEPNPRFPHNNSIRIGPSGLGLPDRSFYYADTGNKVVEAYKRLVKDVVILLQATSSEALKFSTDLFFYEKRIAEITPDTQFLLDPVKTYNPITVSELKITAASLPLREILVSMFPNAGITDETEIIVSSPEYLTAISGIVSSTDRSALNDYVIWTLVREYLPYLPSEYTAELQQYISELTGVSSSLPRWEICANMVQRFMGLAVHAMMEKLYPISERSQKVVENVFKSIRNATIKHIKEYGFPTDLERYTRQKVSSLTMQIGLPKNTTDNKYITNYYMKLYVQKSNLFQNIFNGFSFLRGVQQEQYLYPKPEYRFIPYNVASTPKCSYSPAVNSIVMPRSLLMEPNFADKYPRSIIYGRIGVDIASAIAESILPKQVSWSKDKGLLSQYHSVVNQSEQMSINPRNCLSRFLVKRNIISQEVADLTSLSTLKHISAVKLTHMGLNLALKGQEHIHQPTLEIYEDSALFFIAYSQGLCSIYSEQQQMLDHLVNFKLTDKELLTVAWSHIPSFSENFVCDKSRNEHCSDIL